MYHMSQNTLEANIENLGQAQVSMTIKNSNMSYNWKSGGWQTLGAAQ